MTLYQDLSQRYEIITYKVWGISRYFVYDRWHNMSGNRGHQSFESAVKKLHKILN